MIASALARRGRLIVVILLVLGRASLANAEQDSLTPLLGALDLRGYRAFTTPPNFTADTFDAHELSLAKLRGNVIVVNFWASWCAECRPEMPIFERLHRESAGRGLVVIGVNAREPAQTIERYARELKLTFPLVVDSSGTVSTLYGVVGLPTTFLIARDGRAVAFAVGPRDWASPPARTLIKALLNEQPVGSSGTR